MDEQIEIGSKRKVQEDPDYLFEQDKKRVKYDEHQQKCRLQQEHLEKASKAYDILSRNFTLELEHKEIEIETIDKMILQVQKSLHLVRYAAVTNMFSGVNVTGTNTQETAIHPATRKLLQGKRPVTLSSSSKCSPTENSSSSKTFQKEQQIVPSYVPPKSTEVKFEPRGAQYKRKRRIIVGNVSRWIECDQREDLSTHKWMLYVRGSKEEPDVSDVVSKVRFLIHQSYHPNNLIEVEKPPFHLTRRGWGEFPARIQIHFKNPSDKPIDVVHSLKLDKTYTGLQTFGAETLVDVWLHQSSEPNSEMASENKIVIKTEPSAFSNSTESATRKTPEKLMIKTEIKTEPMEFNEINDKKAVKSKENFSDRTAQTTFIRCKDKDGGSYFLPVTVLPKNCQKKVDWNRTPVVPLRPQRQLPTDHSIEVQMMSNGHDVPKQHESTNGFNGSLLESVGSMLKGSSLPAGTSLLRNKVGKFSTPPMTPPSLSRPGTPNSITSTPTKFSKIEKTLTWEYVLSGKPNLSLEGFENRISKRDSSLAHKKLEYIYLLREKLLSLKMSDFPTPDLFLLRIFRYFPLVSHHSKESSLFRCMMPFVAKSVKEFQSWTLTKQKASEWIRSKTVNRILTFLKGPRKSTKEIMIMFREFGFSNIFGDQTSHSNTVLPEVDFSQFSTFSPFFDDVTKTKSINRQSCNDGESQVFIDIENVEDDSVKTRQKDDASIGNLAVNKSGNIGRLILTDDNLDAQSYIEQSVNQLGIRTEIEEIHPSVYYPLAQKMLLTVCKSFCEEVIRLSHVESFNETKSSGEIQIQHVIQAILKSERLSHLTNKGLGESSVHQPKNEFTI